MIIAVGGAGCNMGEYCKSNASAEWLKNAKFIFVDTDINNVTRLNNKGYQTLTIKPDSSDIYFTSLSDVQNIIILAGLGGKTGSNYVETAAKMFQSMGVNNITIVVTIPFVFEGTDKVTAASEALKSLSPFHVITGFNYW